MSDLGKAEAIHFESIYPPEVRSADIKKALEFIKKGNSVQVLGLPGVGRSNLLRLFAYNNKLRLKHLGENYKWFHFVYMDLSEIKSRSMADIVKFILMSLSYSLSERKMEEEKNRIEEFLKEGLNIPDEMVLFQSLKKSIDYLSIEKELTVVLLFDRFDVFYQALSPDFFTNLRILRNRAKYRFSCVFSLPRPLEEVLEPLFLSDFYEFVAGNNIYLTLSDKYANDFRFSYLEKVSGKNLDPKTKEKVAELTGGHGKLSRIALELILAEEKVSDSLSDFLFTKDAIKGALFEIWNSLSPLEQKVLVKDDLENLGSDSYLELSNLVKNKKIQIPLLENFLTSFPQTLNEQIIYIPESNEIKMGEESFTEKLSPSEFKLLKYLIQNKDKVCEKEEIINAVWNDSKTLEGVTDQALDQIVYRLRRKIEEDPNNPSRIQTIKGRGYRFS
jgi:DNA-binding winged helix-turn-helix (wHTH) protein